MSACIPVSMARTSAAAAVGATPNALRPLAVKFRAAVASVVVLPAPAGATINSNRHRRRQPPPRPPVRG